MVDRHHKMIDTIITDTKKREDLFNTVDALLEQLRSIYFGVYLIHDLVKTQNAIVSYGERLSSNIVAKLIKGASGLMPAISLRPNLKTAHSPG